MRDVLSGQVIVPDRLMRPATRHIEAFDLAPQVRISNQLADNASVIEVSGLDRPGLLYALLRALFDLNLSVRRAIATFGERAVDVFHITDLSAGKSPRRHGRKTARRFAPLS